MPTSSLRIFVNMSIVGRAHEPAAKQESKHGVVMTMPYNQYVR